MENDDSRSSSEDCSEHISTREMVQKMDLGEKSSLKSDEGNLVELADKKTRSSSTGSSRMEDQLKSFEQHSKGQADHPSSENIRHTDQDSQLSTHKPERTNEQTEKFERNLEKFMKEREPLKEVQLRKKTEISARLVKSDGEMAKIIECCGDVLKLSSNCSNSERSSAPPTFNDETETKQNIQTEKLLGDESSTKNVNLKQAPHTSDILKEGAVGTETSSPTRALDLRLSKISAFKVPISPDQKKTPDESPKIVPTGSNEDVTTPVQNRPTHLNVRPRKAFYTFSPGSSSGVLRQCQSLPEINRPRRKDEAQRRSINFGEHSRIVRFLFKDEPEPATPESKVSTFYKTNILVEKPDKSEDAPEVEAPKTSQSRSSKICRKLVFGSCSKKTTEKNLNVAEIKLSCVVQVPKCTSVENSPQEVETKAFQKHVSKTNRKLIFGSSPKETANSQQTGVSCDSESPSKRKIASLVEAGCSISTKKVRTSSETDVKESEISENVRKSLDDVECFISAKKARTSLETKIQESGRDENVKLAEIKCSIPLNKVKISSRTKMEGSGIGENVKKNLSPIDVECLTSTKKVETSSEIIVHSGSSENVTEHEIPVEGGSFSNETVEISETKVKESERG